MGGKVMRGKGRGRGGDKGEGKLRPLSKIPESSPEFRLLAA